MNTYYDEILEIPNAFDHAFGNVYLGGIQSDYSQFDYVICCTPDARHFDRTAQITHYVPFNDCATLPSEGFISEVVDLITRCNSAGRTLVHCSAGVNRSAMMVALAMVQSGYQPQEAINHLRETRSCSVLCNPVFENRVMAS
jgi:protein tyrosine phosphatase